MAIQVGDKVCYSKKFLQSISCVTGDLPFARGTISEINNLGGIKIATIDWGDPEIPTKVNVANLTKVTAKGILES